MHVAGMLARRLEAPAVVEPPKRPVHVLHIDDKLRLVEHHLRGETLADRLVADTHLGHEDFAPLALTPRAHVEALAQRQELRIFLHIRHQVEHLHGAETYRMDFGKLRHSSAVHAGRRASRASRSRAKSSPAWCDERVSGLDDTS